MPNLTITDNQYSTLGREIGSAPSSFLSPTITCPFSIPSNTVKVRCPEDFPCLGRRGHNPPLHMPLYRLSR
ncbi:hypothetical protein E2C01_065071 [Portunus trituberculatus]|uniref:Uncharacterized protein n=1 Tax=Portunus trituberculatus TaxID=210409 RepID=A0A5B7HKW8_PORTR|nr:hypothetical protein [Portunus trituberculatus]